MDVDIIITTDRTMMTNHHGREFLGFMTTSPAVFMPEFLWLHVSCPKPPVDKHGRPKFAPYGLRKIEAALQGSGFNAHIIDPDHLGRHADRAKVLMIGHHDYFGYGPPSSEWWALTGREPINRRSFTRFMDSKAVSLMKKNEAKIVVGGPAAWQWLWEPQLAEKWGIDVIVEGEADKLIVELAGKLLNGEHVPKYIKVEAGEVPSVEEIPVIKAPSVNGLVEIMRSCPRGCSFCSVTLKPVRHIPIEKIMREIEVNVRNGIKEAILHSEDVLLYGADSVFPREEKVMELHKAVLNSIDGLAWSHFSISALVYAQRESRLITKLADLIHSRIESQFIGVEVGIETGSTRLVQMMMPAKAAPFKTEEWPDMVEEAFSIMHDHDIVPAATFILGLPEEEPEDVFKTIELLDRLKPYRSIIVPMFFVPMGTLKDRENGIKGMRFAKGHVEAAKLAFNHTLRWSKDIIKGHYLKGPRLALSRLLIYLFIKFAEQKKEEVEKYLRSAEGEKIALHEFKG